MEEETNEIVKIASDNKLLSDNTGKISLFNIENDFSGLANVVACFFPSMRHEMILRYRAETIAKIGIEAYKIVQNQNIQINPIPPKIAMSLIDKMSLEHEPDMYEKWAKLLIAAGVNHNPIHQQYADILSNLNKQSANLLKEIYISQKNPNEETGYDEFINSLSFQKHYEEIERNSPWRPSDGISPLPKSSRLFHSWFRFPHIIYGSEEKIEANIPIYESSNVNRTDYLHLIFSDNDNKMLLGLEKLGLIKHMPYYRDSRQDENGKKYKQMVVESCYHNTDIYLLIVLNTQINNICDLITNQNDT